MFTRAVLAVVEVPQLGTLVAGVPGAELVAEAEDALLGARLLLVTAPPAEDRVEAVLADRVEQGLGLQRVAATSTMTSCTVTASDSTAPVQDMSPTVR